MKAYWISLYVKVENQDNLKRYAETVTPIIKKFWGSSFSKRRKSQNI
jgi:uncharacterized protein (DUF1330 family)